MQRLKNEAGMCCRIDNLENTLCVTHCDPRLKNPGYAPTFVRFWLAAKF